MWELIRANKRKSLILFFCMGICLVLLGYIIGEASVKHGGMGGILIAFFVWIILSIISYFSGGSILLAVSKAKEVTHDMHPQLFNIVEEMKIAANMPTIPRVYIIDDPTPNAFATGRSPQKSAIAVTSGLLTRLNRNELQGVIAHEMSHIINRDVLFCTFAGILLGSIVLISQVFLRSLWYSGGSRRSRRSSGSGGGQAQMIMMIVAIVFAILAPIFARLLYFAISRKREYLADASAVRLTRYPEGLASALEKISRSGIIPASVKVNKVTAPMYIINPFELQKKMNFSSLSSTHPPTHERIQILRNMSQGVNFNNYQEAAGRINKGISNIMPVSALANKESVSIIKPPKEEKKKKSTKEQVRDISDLLRAANGFAFLICACGLKIKLPSNYNKPHVKCPRCSRQLAVPLASAAAITSVLDKAVKEEKNKEPNTYTRKGKGWESFSCTCGHNISLSPSFSAPFMTCIKCKQKTTIN